MNKSIKTIITTILLISINSVFANSINFKKLNNPGYQNQLKAKYDMHEVIENCYINSETGNILIATKDATMAYIGKESYFDNKLVHFNNGKLKFTNFDFKKESIPVLEGVIEVNVITWAHYLSSIDYFYKFSDLYKRNYDYMNEVLEKMEKAVSDNDVEAYHQLEEHFDHFKDNAEKCRTAALEYKEEVEASETKLDGAVTAFEALIRCRGDLNGK